MSKKNRVCRAGDFYLALTDILNEVEKDVDESIKEPVVKNLKKGKNELRATSPVKTGEYAAGWAYSLNPKKKGVFGEIGNKDKPGLVHLLENGHAKVGGGFVPAQPHVRPVADRLERSLIEDINHSLKEHL